MRIFFFLMVVCFSLSIYANSENIEKSKNKLKVDSLIFFDVKNDSIIWYEPFQKNQYVYYDNGNLKEFYLSKFRIEIGKWDKDDKVCYEYDKNNNVIKIIDYYWKDDLNEWRLSKIEEKKYNLFNKIVEELVSTYYDDALYSKFKTLFEYDQNSNIIQKAKYEEKDSIWILKELIESIFEDNRLITENYTNVYDDFKYYINDTNGYTFYWKLDTSYYSIKHNYEINEFGQIIKDSISSGYVTKMKYKGNNLISETNYEYGNDIKSIRFIDKFTYEYDDKDSLISKIQYYWDDENMHWVPNFREIYNFDDYGNLVEFDFSRYNTNDSTFSWSKSKIIIKMDTTIFLKDIMYPKRVFFYATNKMQNIPLTAYQLSWSYKTMSFQEYYNRIRYYYSKVK